MLKIPMPIKIKPRMIATAEAVLIPESGFNPPRAEEVTAEAAELAADPTALPISPRLGRDGKLGSEVVFSPLKFGNGVNAGVLIPLTSY
jgi:hypothetical protein